MKRHVHKFSVLLLVLGAFLSLGMVIPADRGLWPLDWPQELEPLRSTSRSIDIAHGIQESIFEIPIPDRATFEKVWPAVLKLRTSGSPITLARTETVPSRESSLLSNKKPAIRIYASSYEFSYESMDRETALARLKAGEKHSRPTVGKTLHVGAPWPKSIVGPKGELPEYVVAEKNKDGVLEWVAADFQADQKQGRSRFYNRARIDLELIADGKAIDLATLKLPEDAQVIDKRSENQK